MHGFVRSATAVVVAAIFSLAPGAASAGNTPGTISGSVTAQLAAVPVGGTTVTVYAYDNHSRSWVGRSSTITDLNGGYAFSLAAGSYKVGFQADAYAPELFDDVPSGDLNLATTLTLKSGTTITANAVLREIEDGTATYPWLVYDLASLDAVRTRKGAGVYFKQVRDIDASPTATAGSPWNDGGRGWIPIAEMVGDYDGNGKLISGLTISRFGDSFIGLFGSSTSASLRNIALRGVNVSGGWYVGGLVGDARGLVSSCSVTGAIKGTRYLGGLVGQAIQGATVSGSSANVAVTGQNNWQYGERGYYAGGLVGLVSASTIRTSTSAGSVVGGDQYSGGLVGYAYDSSVIEDSSSSAEVNIQFPGTYTGFGYFGGLVGWVSGGRISRCSASGPVSSIGGVYYYRNYGNGGLVGGGDAGTIVEDSRASGNVTSDGYSTGGLVGWANGLTFTRVSAVGNVSGRGYVGGLVGGSSASTFSACYARGSASAAEGSSGGLLGSSGDLTITTCYATGAAAGGGLVAAVSDPPPTVVDSYWDVTTSGNATSAAGEGRTTEQLQTQSGYGASWDFSNVWFPPFGGVYPTLRTPGVDSLVFSAFGAMPSTASQMCAPGEGQPASFFEVAKNLQPIPEQSFGERMLVQLSRAPVGPMQIILYRYNGQSWEWGWAPVINIAPGQTTGEVSLVGNEFWTVENLQAWFGYPDQSVPPNEGPIDLRVVVELKPAATP